MINWRTCLGSLERWILTGSILVHIPVDINKGSNISFLELVTPRGRSQVNVGGSKSLLTADER